MDLSEVALQIQNLERHIQKLQDDAETASLKGNDEGLSIALSSLARVNSSLGKKAAYAKYIARNSARVVEKLKEEKKAWRSELTLEYSKNQAVNKSEHQARVDAQQKERGIDEAHNAWSEAQLLADEADDLSYRTDTFLKMGQSRLSLLKGDKHRG